MVFFGGVDEIVLASTGDVASFDNSAGVSDVTLGAATSFPHTAEIFVRTRRDKVARRVKQTFCLVRFGRGGEGKVEVETGRLGVSAELGSSPAGDGTVKSKENLGTSCFSLCVLSAGLGVKLNVAGWSGVSKDGH